MTEIILSENKNLSGFIELNQIETNVDVWWVNKQRFANELTILPLSTSNTLFR